MAKKLTERQAAVLAFIKKFAMEYGYPPTIPEIQEEFGCLGGYSFPLEIGGKHNPKFSPGMAE